ncbi:ADP-ribosylation factor-like protein 15 [Pomacea canaliculata]|uniref:ADP-ribosylation factor-like protein 15 n=1 Tax=Pomacea canaliculata TaxID=400727 RepID=UPI000D7276AD|nr:ADP-ribosylation factor-like protein 15 [Pomacea canaliculata]
MCESFNILCALCRVGLYALYRRLCCKGPNPTRPNFSILCIGLEGCGKSSILAVLSGDDLHKIEPTVGFSIKALLFEDCILEVKELGGGDKVRPYWDRYFQVFQGIIFVVNSGASEEDLTLAKSELYKALKHTQLRGLPLLVLGNFSDVAGSRSAEDLIKLLELEKDVGDARQWYLHSCNIHDKDRLQEIFQNFNKILTENLEREIEKRKSNSPTHSQRL